MRWKILLVAMAAGLSIAASPPAKVPVPIPKPPATEPATPKPEKTPPDVAAPPPPPASETPTPEPKPEVPTDATGEKSESPAPSKPDETSPDGKAKDDAAETKAPPEPPLTIEPESEAELEACMADLTALGARFTRIERKDDENGCGIDKPISVDRILPGVDLSPAAEVRCETALQLAQWVKQSVIPAARTGLPEMGPLTSINHASAYVCRKRNNAETGKISEHARGNAVDIGSLSFGKATVPMRIVTLEDSTLADAFQRAINATACLFFSTVLSPGSDAAHQDHMHLDVLERRGGYRFCR